MIQNKEVHQCLFTFNPDKFHQCLPEERKKKFPFLDKRKTKKLSAYQKIKIQQREARNKDEQQSQKKIANSYEEILAQNQNHIALVLTEGNQNKEIDTHRINDPQKLRSNKINLPAVFRANSLMNKKQSHKKRSISSQPGREQRQIQQGKFDNKDRYSAHFPKQQILQSIMLKKYDSLQCNYENSMSLEKSNQLGGQRIHKRNSYAANIGGIDPKVLQGIYQLKKIYN